MNSLRWGLLVLAGNLLGCEGGAIESTLTARRDGGPPPDQEVVMQPSVEQCNGFDENGDGQIDEGCLCRSGTVQKCFPGLPAQAGVGLCKLGTMTCQGDLEFGSWGACTGAVGPEPEVCGNTIDEDCDGTAPPCPQQQPDTGAPKPDAGPPLPPPQCKVGQKAFCYDGPPGTAGKGICMPGFKLCQASGTWGGCLFQVLPKTEVCDNVIDENCDGKSDLCPGTIALPLFIDGDCVTAACPPSAPHPVGCSINFDGGDNRGCVANAPGSSVVYFQEGDKCGAGHLSGMLFCSSSPGSGLNLLTCPINKSKKYYPPDKSGCPAT